MTCPADGFAFKPVTVRTPDGSEAPRVDPEAARRERRSRFCASIQIGAAGQVDCRASGDPPSDYVPAHAAAGYYVGCTILPLPIVSCMSANGPDELRECCLVFPTPLGVYQEWRRAGRTNRFKKVDAEGWKDVSAGSHNKMDCTICGPSKMDCTICAAKLNCCTRRGTSSDVELGKAVPAVEETVSRRGHGDGEICAPRGRRGGFARGHGDGGCRPRGRRDGFARGHGDGGWGDGGWRARARRRRSTTSSTR